MSERSHREWLAQYESSHRHPVNRWCHTVGIPLIVLAVLAAVPALWFSRLWPVVAVLFVSGWVFQFVGHAYEHKRPEFLNDWRFLFVGVRWWLWKVRGRPQ